MKESNSRSILAIVALDKKEIMESGVPAFIASDKESQEKISSELARVLSGNIYGLANGVIIITEE